MTTAGPVGRVLVSPRFHSAWLIFPKLISLSNMSFVTVLSVQLIVSYDTCPG